MFFDRNTCICMYILLHYVINIGALLLTDRVGFSNEKPSREITKERKFLPWKRQPGSISTVHTYLIAMVYEWMCLAKRTVTIIRTKLKYELFWRQYHLKRLKMQLHLRKNDIFNAVQVGYQKPVWIFSNQKASYSPRQHKGGGSFVVTANQMVYSQCLCLSATVNLIDISDSLRTVLILQFLLLLALQFKKLMSIDKTRSLHGCGQ